jgi:hypothetical protein
MRFSGVMLAALISLCAQAQDPLTTLPQNYKVIFENADFKVIRAHYGPLEKVPVHDHPGVATIFVYLNDSGKVRIDHDGDGAESVVRPPTVQGSYRVAPALAERHSIENLGTQSSEFLRIELKRVVLTMKEPFRGKAPARPLKSEDEVEFTQPAVQIERVICVGTTPCAIKAEPAPSLLVVLSPVFFSAGQGVRGAEQSGLDTGAVHVLGAKETALLTPMGPLPVQVLRVILPSL